MLILSPIEQFNVIPLFFLSNVSLTMILILFSVIYFTSNYYLLNKHLEFWITSISEYRGQIFVLVTVYMLIFLSNIIGMIPYSNTITVQLAIVLSISLPCFISLNINGIINHRENIFYLFLPSGAPTWIIPILVVLEIFSYFMRLFALTLRLAANLLSGHILMKIILYILVSNILIAPLIIPIIFLELFVAGIQSYVFLLLLITYNNDVIHPH